MPLRPRLRLRRRSAAQGVARPLGTGMATRSILPTGGGGGGGNAPPPALAGQLSPATLASIASAIGQSLGGGAPVSGNQQTGAGIGASVGSIIPGIGTAIGAAIGGAAGQVVDLFNVGELPGSTSGNAGKIAIDLLLTGGLLNTLGIAPNFAGTGISQARRKGAQGVLFEVPTLLEANRRLGQSPGGFAQGGLPFLRQLAQSDPAFARELAVTFAAVAPLVHPDLARPIASRVFGPAILAGDTRGERILEALRTLDPRFPTVNPDVLLRGPEGFNEPLVQFVNQVAPGVLPVPADAPAPAPPQLPSNVDPTTGRVPVATGGPMANVPTSFAALQRRGFLGDLGGALGGILNAGVQLAPQILPQILGGIGGGAAGGIVSGAVLPGGFAPALTSQVDLPFLDIVSQGQGQLSEPFRSTPAGASAQTHVRVNPVTGKTVWFKPAGRPVLFSGDLRACRQVERLAKRAKRAAGRRGGR